MRQGKKKIQPLHQKSRSIEERRLAKCCYLLSWVKIHIVPYMVLFISSSEHSQKKKQNSSLQSPLRHTPSLSYKYPAEVHGNEPASGSEFSLCLKLSEVLHSHASSHSALNNLLTILSEFMLPT